MNDSAEPHSSSLARLCSRSGRRGPNAFWRIDGSDGLDRARYGNSSMTTGTGPSRPSASSASATSRQSLNSSGAGVPRYAPRSDPIRRSDSPSVASSAAK
jgi:hypothetical protein